MNSLMTTFLSVLLFVATFNFAHLEAQNLSDTEKKIVELIDKDQAHSLALLEKVVNINSGTMNFEGVKEVGMVLQKEFEAIGFDAKWIDGKAFDRSGHLVASYGNKGKKLLLIGHLDTVFAKDSPFQFFKVIDENSIAGPGITDMKGGDIVMISALKALKQVGVLDNLQIRVVITGDEEKRGKPMELANKALIDAGKWADVALGFEDGDGNPKTAVVSRRGSTGWQLEVKGRPAHSSQIFREDYGDGAIFETARILNQFREKLSSETNLTFNPGVILGGTDVEFDSGLGKGTSFGKTNVIAQSTIVAGDIRAISPEQLVKAQSMMNDIVSQNLNKTSASLNFFPGYPPMAPSEGNKRLLEIYNQASQSLGFGSVAAVDPRKAGAADISFVANYVDMALDGLGLMGKGGHTVNEVADIRTLASQTKRAAILMSRLVAN